MISLLEVAERAQKGPRLEEKDWNLGMFKKMQNLVAEHRLKIGSFDKFYDVDNSYADRLFQAALGYLSSMGVYCVSTNREIQFTEDEVEEACREAPDSILVGRDRDVREVRQRSIEDRRPPNIIAGGHSAWNEELIPLENMVKELVKHPRVDYLETFMFHRIMGREVHGIPMAVYAARKAIERSRIGIGLAGRPGMALCNYPVLTNASAFIAAKDEDRGLRSSDGLLLSVLPDLKVETDLLAASMYYEEYGCFRANGGTGSFVGSFAGGWEGAMIEAVVRNIAAWIIYHDCVQYAPGISVMKRSSISPTEKNREPLQSGDDRMAAWCSFAADTALRRHKKTIQLSQGGNGAVVEDNASLESLFSIASQSIRGTVTGNGLWFLWTPPPTTVSWGIEVSDAALRSNVKLGDLDGLLGRIQREKLQSLDTSRDMRMLLYSNPKAFFETMTVGYDYAKQRPTDRFVQNRRTAMQYLESIGLRFR